MPAEKLEFHYIKSPHFKSFLASGAYGGIGPNGLINMSFYIERTPIPQKLVFEVKDGLPGNEIVEERIGKGGFIREIDCNIMIDLNTAINLREWLDSNIKTLETVIKAAKESRERKSQ